MEMIKIKVEINEIETLKIIEKINETSSWFFKKINKIDKQDSSKKKRRRNKGGRDGSKRNQIKLEMKEEKLQPTSQKYKGF